MLSDTSKCFAHWPEKGELYDVGGATLLSAARRMYVYIAGGKQRDVSVFAHRLAVFLRLLPARSWNHFLDVIIEKAN